TQYLYFPPFYLRRFVYMSPILLVDNYLLLLLSSAQSHYLHIDLMAIAPIWPVVVPGYFVHHIVSISWHVMPQGNSHLQSQFHHHDPSPLTLLIALVISFWVFALTFYNSFLFCVI